VEIKLVDNIYQDLLYNIMVTKVPIRKASREDYDEVMTKVRSLSREQRVRLLLLEMYGGKCKRCDNSDYRVLQLDHVNDDAPEDRKKYGLSKRKIYLKIIKGEVDKNRYQLLCANCNWIKKYEI